MNKRQIVHYLEEIAVYLEIKGENPFKVSAYRKAAQSLETDERSLSEIEDLSKIKGIGKGTAGVIQELMDTGSSTLLVSLREEIPADLLQLLKIPGLGAKKIAKLYQQLGITDLMSLKNACENKTVRHLEGFGVKTEEKLLKAIGELTARPERLPIAYMLSIADHIEKVLISIEAIEQFSRAGSLRRHRETMKDLDFVIATIDPEAVSQELLKALAVKDVIGHGETKISLTLNDEFQVGIDFRLVQPDDFATALHHFTGSKEHNVLMRRLAKSRGEKISEYGVETADGERLTFPDEAAFFNHFGLNFIPPECREGEQELERATIGHSLHLIHENQIKSDLHMHTTWSDGANTLEEMAHAAILKGYEYIVITDHSKSLRVANGLSEEHLREQRMHIRELNQKYTGQLHIFSGVEMDILPDGRLDYGDDMLEELDFVIAAIHSSFSQNEEQIMHRLETAMRHPKVRLIAHPAGRLIGRREGYRVNLERLIDLAVDTGTALELNASLNRLDLSAEGLKRAREKGVKFCINTDAHSLDGLDNMSIGVSYAKKAWLTPKDVINTYTLSEFKTFLKTKKHF